MEEREKLKKALMKKALGYQTKEVTEEFSVDSSGEEKLSKRKVTKKQVAPDNTALKILLEKFFEEDVEDYSNLSDQELEQKRQEILQLLKEEEYET